jgi:hypothetical protein
MKKIKSKKLWIAVCIFFGVLNPAQGGATSFGGSDCGEWVNGSKSNAPMRAWLLGYMSGLGAMHDLNGRDDDPLDKINSAQQIYLWMDNFCQKNPLRSVRSGGVDLFLELMKK